LVEFNAIATAPL